MITVLIGVSDHWPQYPYDTMPGRRDKRACIVLPAPATFHTHGVSGYTITVSHQSPPRVAVLLLLRRTDFASDELVR